MTVSKWQGIVDSLLAPGDTSLVLRAFDSVEEGARLKLLSKQVLPWQFNPRLVAPLLDEGERYLESCFQLKAEAMQLELQAFESALQFALAAEMEAIEDEEADAGSDDQVLEGIALECAGLNDAGIEFDAAHAEEIGKGSKRAWMGVSKFLAGQLRAKSVSQQVEGKIRSAKLAERRRAALRRMRKLRLRRAQELGTANNYDQRFSEIKSLFDHDLEEAFTRLICAEEGLKEVYGIKVSVRKAISDELTGPLAGLLLWSRDVRSQLDRLLQNDQQFDVSIMLKRSGAMDDAQLEKGQQAGVFDFNIGPEHFEGMGCLRLRTVRVSILSGANDDQKELGDQFRDAFFVWAKVPVQRDGSGKRIPCAVHGIPLAQCRDVRLHSSVYSTEGLVGYNANPVGLWQLEVRDAVSQRNMMNRRDITDFELVLRVASVVRDGAIGEEEDWGGGV